MTAAAPVRPIASWSRLTDDGRQFLAVAMVVVVGLAAGLGLKLVSENQTRNVTAGGVTAGTPRSWIYQSGAGDLLFSVRDPLHPGLQYSVSLVASGSDLARVVDNQVRAKSGILNDFQQLSREPAASAGRTGQAVTYAYVVTREGRAPAVIQGRDLYLPAAGSVLVISLQSPIATFDDALPGFNRFADSVRS